MQDNNTFLADIVQPNGELITLDDVVAIRVISRDYNLLIMKDHMPIIGEVDGSLIIQGKASRYSMDAGIGYYVNNDNKFTFIIKKLQSGGLQIPIDAISEKVHEP